MKEAENNANPKQDANEADMSKKNDSNIENNTENNNEKNIEKNTPSQNPQSENDNKMQTQTQPPEKDQLIKKPKKKSHSRKRSEENHSTLEMLLYIIVVTFLFIVLICIFYYIHYSEYKVEVLLEDKDIIKPVIDSRKYKIIKLQNNIDILLISDKNITKCSTGLSIGVGSMHDSFEIPGLSHFTEHTIFLGSKSYPRPSTFESHLSNHLGMTNAYTDEEKTVFYFEVEWHGFIKALDMFSRMFAEPLFDINYMEKEIKSVNSEKIKNYNNDAWRENQVIKDLANKTHPFSKFSTGSMDILKSVSLKYLREKIIEHYNKYYMPDNMKLVVLSNQNLDQLQNTVSYYFSDVREERMEEKSRKEFEAEGEKSEKEVDRTSETTDKSDNSNNNSNNIPDVKSFDEIKSDYDYMKIPYKISNNDLNRNDDDDKPTDPVPKSSTYKPLFNNTMTRPYSYLPFPKGGKILWYQKISGSPQLDIIFNLDEIITKFRTKPLNYISYLIKYSGQGSLIEYLKKNKLATKLQAGVVFSFKHFSQYAVSVSLTNDGIKNITDVIQITYKYINLIKTTPISPSTYDELHNITSVQFKFLEKAEKNNDYISNIASNLGYLKDNEYDNILFMDYIHADYNSTIISNYLNKLHPDNSIIVVGSVDKPTSIETLLKNPVNKTEKYYNTSYIKSKMTDEQTRNFADSSFDDGNLNLTANGNNFTLRDKNEFITKESDVVSCFGVGIITSYKNVTLHELCDIEKEDLKPDMAINSTNLVAWYKVCKYVVRFSYYIIAISASFSISIYFHPY